jgi:hypothetical protein
MSSLFKTKKYINFHNNTELPIMIDSWVDGSNYLNMLKVSPGEKLIIHSKFGEWHINSMLEDDADYSIWINLGLKWYVNIGKFRSNSYINEEYSFMEWPHIFNCLYSECDPVINPKTGEYITGLITFVFTPSQI